MIAVPWDLANRRLSFELQLVDEDGQPVMTTDPMGNDAPIAFGGQLEVGRPTGLIRGVSLDVPLAIQMQPMVLPVGKRFEWVLTINSESKEDWRLPFLIMTPPR